MMMTARNGILNMATVSWLLVPLFAFVLGMGHLYPNFPANRQPYSRWISPIARIFFANNITWNGVQSTVQPGYIEPQTQNQLLSLIQRGNARVELEITIHANELADIAINIQ
jgi:hypothetical protein